MTAEIKTRKSVCQGNNLKRDEMRPALTLEVLEPVVSYIKIVQTQFMKHVGREKAVEGSGHVVLDLTSYVPALVHHIANKLRHGGHAMYKKTFGIGLSEWMVMAILAGEDGITAQRICEVIGLDKAQVSRVTKGLAQRRLIAVGSDGADSRKSKITLTFWGRELHDRIMLDALEREKRLVRGLSDSEVTTLRSLLVRVHANIPSANSPIRLVKDR